MAQKELIQIRFIVSPKLNSMNWDEYGGAYANCWINIEDQDEAISEATATLLDEEWEIKELESIKRVNIDEEEENKDEIAQALSDGSCYRIHTWPKDEENK